MTQGLEVKIQQLIAEGELQGGTARRCQQQSPDAMLQEQLKQLPGLPGANKDKFSVIFLVEIEPGHDGMYCYPIFNESGGPKAALHTAIRRHLGKERGEPHCCFLITLVPERGYFKLKDASLRRALDEAVN